MVSVPPTGYTVKHDLVYTRKGQSGGDQTTVADITYNLLIFPSPEGLMV